MRLNKKIRVGTAGVEARLYVVSGYRSTTERTDKDGKRTPMETLRLGADDISDVIAHLKKHEPDYDIYSIRLVGMVVVTSGSGYGG